MKCSLKKLQGIRFQLLLALTGVVTTAFLGSVIAWLVYSEFSEHLDQISNVHLPSIVNATDLSGKGVALVSAVPTLVAANDDLEMKNANITLQSLLTGMRKILNQQKKSGNQANDILSVNNLVDDIDANLKQIQLSVNHRLTLESSYNKKTQRLIWLQADFQDEIQPIIDDANFNVSSFSKRLQGKVFNAKNATIFKQKMAQQQILLELLADGNLMVSVLFNTEGSNQAELVIHKRMVAQQLQKTHTSLRLIKSISSTISLRQFLTEYESIAIKSDGIFAIQQQLLAIEEDQKKSIIINQKLIEQMTALIGKKVDLAQKASQLAAIESQQALIRGRITLAIAALVGLVLAVWLAWFYVGKNVMSRILTLNLSMSDIASGNLLAQVNIAGNDEITEMAQALLVFRDTALAVEEANAQAIIDNSLASLIATDSKMNISFFNPTAGAIFGISPKEAIGLPFSQLIIPECRETIQALFVKARDEKQPMELNTKISGTKSNGELLALEIAIRPFKQRQRLHFLLTIHDITELKHTEELLHERVAEQTKHLRLMNRDLQKEVAERGRVEQELRDTQDEMVQTAKLAVMGQITTNIAHELNQPLAALQAYSHNINILLSSQSYQEIENISKKFTKLITRMAETVKRFRVFARQPIQQIASINLEKVLDNAVELFEHNFVRENVSFTVTGKDSSIQVVGEEIRLEQVLINLISNAIQAMDGSENKQLIIKIIEQKGQVSIDVCDNGRGLTKDEVEKVFEPFYTTKDVGKGLGIGLSISHNIISGFGGELTLTTNAQAMTVFSLSLKKG